MNAKRKGTGIERKALTLLRTLGYEAHRTPASLGAFDVFAWQPGGHLRCIQVKGGKRPWCRPAERQAMRDTPIPARATREIWLWADYAREPQIQVL